MVPTDIRDLLLESQHGQSFLNAFICQLQYRKDANKEKEAGNGPFFFKKPSTNEELLLILINFLDGLENQIIRLIPTSLCLRKKIGNSWD